MAAQTTLSQFRAHGGIPAATLGADSISPETITLKIEAAEAVAYGYISARHAKPFALPLPIEFVVAVCSIAAHEVMMHIGYNPETPGDVNYKQRRDDAIAWLRDVGKGAARIAEAVDATPSTNEGSPECYTATPRGWV